MLAVRRGCRGLGGWRRDRRLRPKPYTLNPAGGLAAGGAIGAYTAKRMAITDLPQMVAAFHSLVGLAAVTTSIASYVQDPHAAMDGVHLMSTYLGTFIGAVTLTGALQGGSDSRRSWLAASAVEPGPWRGRFACRAL
jgi:NAD(P) transhydrogenase beta subunit